MLELILQAPVALIFFLVTIATSIMALKDPVLKQRFILHPWSFVRDKKYYTILTSGLIHANWLHLGMNMMAFYFFAFGLEATMVREQIFNMGEFHGFPAWFPVAVGHLKFAILYLVCLFLADLTTLIRFKDQPAYSSLGASGAISGVLISYILFHPIGGSIWGLPPWLFALVYLVGSYLFSLKGDGKVNHEAHLWGGIAGLIFTPLLFPHMVQVILGTISGLF